MKLLTSCFAFLLVITTACSGQGQRGIADKRSDFRQFIPMKTDPRKDGLREVKPFFRRAERAEIVRAIEHACTSGRDGSSVLDERTGAGYYVNCNPRNRQLLNGYVPLNSRQEPHAHSQQ